MVSSNTKPILDRASDRWLAAQERERSVWQREDGPRADYVARRARYVAEWMRFWGADSGRVLEIGGAGLPVIDALEGFSERHAVDPLMEDYRALFGTDGHAARAESLPFDEDRFDAVVMLNVLDHVDDPSVALRETARVLRPEGRLFFSCDVYGRAWLALRAVRVRVTGKRTNDWLHPHHFTARTLWRAVEREFEILEAGTRWLDPLLGERASRAAPHAGGWKNRIKNESRLYFVARPRT